MKSRAIIHSGPGSGLCALFLTQFFSTRTYLQTFCRCGHLGLEKLSHFPGVIPLVIERVVTQIQELSDSNIYSLDSFIWG